ncbi:hypothetical protein TW81_13500 [Vibrio galatheae]|uniref:Uncharacterized protein n=1 Tax=Vibrio galatheae TaxID=579748 RepID=A0A0F4NHX1_9VIBR|nr:hypothetical protein [Vibrio galatheae]KJY82423.1 hypothetical protein TW81_13500 [Vibrio galatheae]
MRIVYILLFLFPFSAHAVAYYTLIGTTEPVFSSMSALSQYYVEVSGCVQSGSIYKKPVIKTIYVNAFSYYSREFSDSECTDTWSTGKTYTYNPTAVDDQCPEGTILDPEAGRCVEDNKCEPLAGNTTSHTWDYMKYGDEPTFCSGGCELKVTGSTCSLANATPGNGCGGTVVVTGKTCNEGEPSPGGTIPDEVPQGCQDFNGTYLCPEDSNGDGQPDDGQPLDPDAKCGYDGNDQFSCQGGTYAEPDYEMQDPTKPLEGVESSPLDPANVPIETVEGVAPPTDETGEREQIKLLNEQINALLEGLNADNNANFKKMVDELKNANQFNQQQLDQIVASTNKQLEIWDELKTLQMQSTEDIVNAINDSAEYDEFYNNQAAARHSELLAALQGLGSGNGEGSQAEKDILDVLTNGNGTIDGTQAAYNSEHTTQSLSEEMVLRLFQTRDVVYEGMLDAFADIDLSNAKRPDFSLDLEPMGFKKYSLETAFNVDYIFGFIRICILFTAALTCRKIIFGG